MLNPKIIEVNKSITLVIMDLPHIDDELRKFLDSHIIEICEGASDSELQAIKDRFLSFLEKKSKNTKYGAIAEFFIHAHLKHSGFKQEFLFFNLEEGSIKKGFDGIFTKNKSEYIVESKSGASDAIGISHESKLREAYSDLKGYFSGTNKKSSNNPWRNAYNHACHADVGTAKSIRNKIKSLSDLYDSKKFKEITEFNIVPCSTIFMLKNSAVEFSNKIEGDYSFLDGFKGNTTRAICITKYTFDSFVEYLRN